MKNVLIISYFFPPLGGPGVQRIAKFVKYLPDFGWNPVVISVKNIEYIAYDESLEKEVSHAEIHRTESLDLMRLLYFYEKWRPKPRQRIYTSANSLVRKQVRDIFPIDPKIGWLPFAVKKGIEICRTKKMHAIFATILPYTSALAAYHIAMRSNIPFIVDYRDLWQGKPDISHFSQWHDQFSTKWEQKILTFSAKAIINTQRAKETIQKLYPMIPAERFSVLYNGFDRHDFEQEVLNKDTNTLLFTYTGGFYGERTPAFFMQAIKELNETGELPLNVRFRFVGNYVQSIIDILSVSELKDFIELIPQVTHQKSVEFLLKSDFLLLFVAKRKSEIVIPAKFFEYLAAQKPILGMVPIQGEAAELIRNLHAGFVMEIDDIPQIKSHILRLCRMSKEEMRADLSCSYHKIKQFERKEQTKRLAEILNAHCR